MLMRPAVRQFEVARQQQVRALRNDRRVLGEAPLVLVEVDVEVRRLEGEPADVGRGAGRRRPLRRRGVVPVVGRRPGGNSVVLVRRSRGRVRLRLRAHARGGQEAGREGGGARGGSLHRDVVSVRAA